MARTQSAIEADLDRLRAARGSPDSEVTYDGKTRKFRNEAEISSAIVQLEQELVGVTKATPKVMTRRIRTRTGW